MIKEFLIRKMLQSKLKDVPPAMQGQLLDMVDKNPDFFMKIAAEIQEKIKTGMAEMPAAMEVMKNHQIELESLTRKQ
ncbi:MAG: hypothetical protein Q7R65_00425 [bacterium]|nr:hypothetical protein [bacterium]